MKGNFDNPDDKLFVASRNFWTDATKAPRLTNNPTLKLRIIIDTNGIEMFADDGLSSLSALFFSEYGIASKMTIQVQSSTKKSQIKLKELNVYELKSIWQKDDGIKKNTLKISSHLKKMFDRINCAKGGK